MAERQSASDEQTSTPPAGSPTDPGPVDPGGGQPVGAPDGAKTVTTPAAVPGAWFQARGDQATQALSVHPGNGSHGRDADVPAAGTDGPSTEAAIDHLVETATPPYHMGTYGMVPYGTIAHRSSTPGAAGTDSPTELLPAVARPGDGSDPARAPSGASPAGSPPLGAARRPLLVAAAVLGLLLLLYVVDLVVSLGAVPRGVTVAGVPVGGLDYAAAEQRLRAEIEPRTTRPVPVTVGQVSSEIDPRAAGLRMDWDATLDAAGSQPLNPFTRIASLFTEREVGVVTATDRAALTSALEQLAPVVDRAPVEGSVKFEGTTPVPVLPAAGQRLEATAAGDVLEREWANGRPVALPLTELTPITTPADVTRAIDEVARPAVSAPVVVIGEQGARATVAPEVTAQALSFRAEQGAGLVPELNQVLIEEALRPQLARTETLGRDATISFATGAPVVVPSQDGRGIDYDVTLRDLLRVLTGTGPRELAAVYSEQPAELTTEEVTGLGIKELVSEFTTRGFAKDSGRNIKRAAEQINGTIVMPGETFSLNGETVPRNAANGYVEAGIIDDGAPSRGIGGGVSQIATTTYNAAYFAGMVDVAHKEHSFYISRYPAGREATVFEGSIDLKFRNDGPAGILIQTAWTPSSITVRMYGTKRYEVTSTPGPRTNPTQPNLVSIPPGQPCIATQGAPGFTITDTRKLREIATGQTRSETRTVRYNPIPIVVCAQ